jgi:hypothetical protein
MKRPGRPCLKRAIDHRTITSRVRLLQPGSTIYAVDRHPAIEQQLTANQVSIQPQKNDFVKKDLGLHDTTQPVPVWVPYPLGFVALQSLFRTIGYQSITRLGQMPSAFGGSNLYGAIIN